MFFRQYDLGCLSLFSYLIGDETTGRAVVVDPQRDIEQYVTDAEANGLRIERIVETHVHADFLSGHLELAAATGAAISYGAGAVTDFPIEELAGGDRIDLGEVVIEIRATPGHTPESISLVLWEHGDDDEPWGVLTGDALFLGDVGRPDLLTSTGVTADDLARLLYQSLQTQLLTLPDATRVYPAHGAGSACGKQLSTDTESTIGEQRRVNYALAPMTEDAFVEVVTEGQTSAPAYFAFASDANRRQHDLADEDPLTQSTIDDALALLAAHGVVLDTRAPETFALGHLRGSINVGLDGRFAEHSGNVVSPDQEIILVADVDRAAEARMRLSRIGFDRVVGHLPQIEASLSERPDLSAQAERLTAHDLAEGLGNRPMLQVVDVRGPGEQASGRIDGAVSAPLPLLIASASDGTLDPRRRTVVYCAGGYRSSIAASTLRTLGFSVADLIGGFGAWASADLPVTTGTGSAG